MYMSQALDQAIRAQKNGDVPIGAILVHNDTVIAAAGNRIEQTSDPTAHAEIVVLREGSKILGTPRLTECDLYVTLEPCPMCAQAIAFSRIRRLYFGAYDPKGGGVDHGPQIFQSSSCHHSPEVYGGIMEKECGGILKDFFDGKRSKPP